MSSSRNSLIEQVVEHGLISPEEKAYKILHLITDGNNEKAVTDRFVMNSHTVELMEQCLKVVNEKYLFKVGENIQISYASHAGNLSDVFIMIPAKSLKNLELRHDLDKAIQWNDKSSPLRLLTLLSVFSNPYTLDAQIFQTNLKPGRI